MNIFTLAPQCLPSERRAKLHNELAAAKEDMKKLHRYRVLRSLRLSSRFSRPDYADLRIAANAPSQ